MAQKRILIFNVNWLGDVLFSTATIRNIRYNFPGAYLACVIPSRCYPVVRDNPHLDEVIIFDEKDRHRTLGQKINFIRELRRKRFDTAFLLHRSLTRALIVRLAGVKERVGYAAKKRGFLLTKKVEAADPQSLHRIDYYLNVIEKAGLKVEDRYTEFFFRPQDEEAVDEFFRKQSIKSGDFIVGINAGGNWGPKRWPKENWAELADQLIEKYNAKILITGGPQDVPLAREIGEMMREQRNLIYACSALTLAQFAALCKRLEVFICADTGPLHIANAVQAKQIIALFGPTHSFVTGPFPSKNVAVLQKEVGCRIPCYEVDCKDNRCMKAISVDEVMEQVKAHLGHGSNQ